MITSTHNFPIIFMVKPSSRKEKISQKPYEKIKIPQRPLPNKAKTCRFFPLLLLHSCSILTIHTEKYLSYSAILDGTYRKQPYGLSEWFSPLNWWRDELRRILTLEEDRRIPGVDYPPLTSIVIIHRPYFQNPNGQIWSKNIAYFWGTFEDYPLDESYKMQLLQHLREINNTESSSSTTNSPSFNRLVPSSSDAQNTGLFKSTTEYYVLEEAQWIEYLSEPNDP
ncbi:hypothetical protein CR513_54369, partial [Mucuna pruriens]